MKARRTTRWTGAAGACFATNSVRRRVFDARRPVNSNVRLLKGEGSMKKSLEQRIEEAIRE